MSILITGGTGYIGSHTAVELLNEGYEVVLIDNFSNSKPEVVNRIRQITSKDFAFFEVDLLDQAALKAVFASQTLSAVIHFAGLKAVGESAQIPLRYYHNNLSGTLNLCALMSEYHVKKMVFSSSATVYGAENTPPFRETMPLSASNPYGQTKLMTEQILRDIYASDPAWSIMLLRYFNPVGAHASGLIGEDPTGIPNNLMPYITQVAAGILEKLTVFGGDYDTFDGTGVRDYLHVVDLAKGHLKALEKVFHTTGVDAVNLGTGIGYSVLDVIANFEKATGICIPYVIGDRRPGDIASCYADAGKAWKTLGWKAKKSLDEMCGDAWNWKHSVCLTAADK